MKEFDNKKLIGLIKNFSKQKIIVIGDLILDKYLWCNIERISPEAPVPIALVENQSYVLGGAANVANNIVSLGAKVDLIGIISNDENSKIVTKMLKEKEIFFSGSIIDNERPTTVKERVMCGNHQSIRIDYEKTDKINILQEDKIIDYIKNNITGVKVIIFSDYNKGLISESLAQKVIVFAANNGIKVLSDPTPNTFEKFKNSFLVKPNQKEAENIVGKNIYTDYSNLKEISSLLANKLNSKIVITLGKYGVATFENDQVSLIPTFAKDVYDVSGAGDTTIAALGLSLSSGGTIEDGAIIGNYCAGIVVSKIGTAVCSDKELIKKIEDN